MIQISGCISFPIRLLALFLFGNLKNLLRFSHVGCWEGASAGTCVCRLIARVPNEDFNLERQRTRRSRETKLTNIDTFKAMSFLPPKLRNYHFHPPIHSSLLWHPHNLVHYQFVSIFDSCYCLVVNTSLPIKN